ncbi:putative glycosyltransferase [BD1-7 clade bacterium]|uniref:Putative glycosyltransferase n=1 Tax=BD1-7 clade bacterium TaxID=2029982 RepID=A0A5S9N3S8_9GAMM|nr:putative glycosyltransferase [BD1-7 clade bacterium]CAA0084386.1 putative glycosyltransferase [BD1-7 clade bacterium]
MYRSLRIGVVIPALNEEGAIGKVVSRLLALTNDEGRIVDQLVVCDNGSTDATATRAADAGADVVTQLEPGYGITCQTAVAALTDVDVVLFVDGDDSCLPDEAVHLLNGIIAGNALAIGSRTLGNMHSGALTMPQRAGNLLAAWLIHWLWHHKVTDLGPFRAIRFDAYQQLQMQDRRFGWTVEMQVKCIQHRLPISEHPVTSTRRIGKSKISGTLRGTLGAAHGILGMIARLYFSTPS